ncbi:MAG: PD-(D/E)XK nuclease domain-containing protein [Kiritimatiellae bacterium]|nr:PD-(D/E)XK nuclease domain-containing protein [Kiritimatiellia bacterium]
MFGRSEYGLDGEITDFVRAWPTVVLNNPFSGAMIAGNPYTAEWQEGRGNVYRFDATNGATLVASIASSEVADSAMIGKAHAIREDVFPERCHYGDVQHSYLIELKFSAKDASEAELAGKYDEALRQLAAYRADPSVPSLARGTTLHQIVYQFKGTELLRAEQIAEEAI